MRKVLHLMGVLNDEDLEWLLSHGETRYVPSGTFVIRQGVPIDVLLILLEGRLSVKVSNPDVRDVATLYPGEILGEISFLNACSPSASVISVEESHLFAVCKKALSAKLDRDNGFAARFYRALGMFLAERLAMTTSHLGYGQWKETDVDEIDESTFDNISLAARRFDDMLKRLRLN